ncbi:hypothetical protein B0O80DRAFT_475402, partial [Mortierella sp. GBAus27b]
MTMSMTMSMPGYDARRRPSLPTTGTTYLTDEERASFIVASSTRRPSVHNLFPTLCSPSPPSSVASSPGDLNNSQHRPQNHNSTGMSPILTPFLWTSDLRQYIMTDIGPQPSNSQMPSLRCESHLVRQVSSSKISPVAGGVCNSPTAVTEGDDCVSSPVVSSAPSTHNGTFARFSSAPDLCTIPQDEVLPPMEVPFEGRFAHQEWDDD